MLIESHQSDHNYMYSTQFNQYLQFMRQLNDETDRFHKLLTDSPNSTMDNFDESQNDITDLGANDEVECKCNELTIHDLTTHSLKFNNPLATTVQSIPLENRLYLAFRQIS